MAGELNLRVLLGRPRVPVLSSEQLVYALVELRPTATATAATLPLNLSLVLDRSGSMRGAKIERLREAVLAVLQGLQAQDTLSVVAFNNKARVLVPSQAATEAGKAAISAEILRLSADGGTNMAPAMEAALRELWQRVGPQTDGAGEGGATRAMNPAVTRMLLLTDGITEKEKRCLEQADAARTMGVPIVALGIGRDWNDKLLETIGERSGGSADYVRNADDIPRHFQRTVQQMQAVALTDAQLDVRNALAVTCRTIFRVHPLISRLTTGAADPAGRSLSAPLGEIAQGHGQTLLLELVVPPRPVGSYRVAQVAVTYQAGSAARETVAADVLLEYSADPTVLREADPAVMNLVEKVTAFKLQTAALADLEAGNLPAATGKLQNALTRLLNQGDVELAATVQAELANLEKGRTMTPEGRKTIRFASGQTVRLDKL
ncbi:MAG: VWA domain-containing protein [Chloroflexota bacterium]|nr:VWA domain-containing protein [Chloroflexota bacterium]